MMRIVLLAFLVMHMPTAYAADGIDGLISQHYLQLEQLYQHLHQHPELSGTEEETAKTVAKEMSKLGFTVHPGVGGHGVVSVLHNGKGPTVMVRTDLDALPITEETGLEYSSKNAGVMHACGHDVHMTTFLGAAYVLSALQDQWKGTLVMIGQPAEEIGEGAKAMLAAGLFEKYPKPDYGLAFHVAANMPAGTLAYRAGYALANVDSVDIVVIGKGGHGAMPDTTIDPVVIASQIIIGLQTIVSRELAPMQSAVITVGSIHGGTKHNIIPSEVKLQLTVRSFEDAVREHLKEAIPRIAKAIALGARAPEPSVLYSEGTPALLNDPDLVAQVVPIMEDVVGKEKVFEQGKYMVGEDFSRYGRAGNIPTFMMTLGSHPSNGPNGTLHSSTYAPDYATTIKTGIKTMASAVMAMQKQFGKGKSL